LSSSAWSRTRNSYSYLGTVRYIKGQALIEVNPVLRLPVILMVLAPDSADVRIGPSSHDGRLPEGRAGAMGGGMRPPADTTAHPRRGLCRSAQAARPTDRWPRHHPRRPNSLPPTRLLLLLDRALAPPRSPRSQASDASAPPTILECNGSSLASRFRPLEQSAPSLGAPSETLLALVQP